jgi:hypothetical protein
MGKSNLIFKLLQALPSLFHVIVCGRDRLLHLSSLVGGSLGCSPPPLN